MVSALMVGTTKLLQIQMDGISQAELKHGRIAMLAFVGLVVPEFVRIPGRRRVDVGPPGIVSPAFREHEIGWNLPQNGESRNSKDL